MFNKYFFLQVVQIELPQQSTNSVLLGLVLVAIIAAIIIAIIRFSATNNNRPGSRQRLQGRTRAFGTIKRYNSWIFRSIASNAGLNKEQIMLLERLIQIFRVAQPFLMFSNAKLLDTLIKKSIYSINQNVNIMPEEKEKRISQLFKIKQQIEHTSRRGIGITSTSLLRPGQTLLLNFPDGKQYRTEVTNNYKSKIACLGPLIGDTNTEKKRWRKGNKLKVLFWRENDSGYVFTSKILGITQAGGERIIHLRHSQSLKRNQQRKFRRRPLAKKCTFFPLEVITTGRGYQTSKKIMIKTDQKATGVINDIGAGGCSIQCQSPIEKGQYLKITFTFNLDELALYGRVIRITKWEDEEEPTMHVMFTRVSGHDRNEIYQYVYNYV